jgi:protein O-GlcNAc transferase
LPTTPIGEGEEADYSEHVWRLPDTYQLNDGEQPIDTAQPTRAELGLPDHATVLGCFNNLSKVDRRSFAVWLRVLQALPDSVLWLLATSTEGMNRLRERARQAGIAPHRLVFAPVVAKAQHLARLPQMDVMLDTLTCNAHTTATDALYCGVPLVTVRGPTFASRVATSLLTAAKVPHLSCVDDDAMVALAIAIA